MMVLGDGIFPMKAENVDDDDDDDDDDDGDDHFIYED